MQKFFKKIVAICEKKPWIVFLLCTFVVFLLFSPLLYSYFESDEWVLFTFYLPLTKQPDGLLTALLSTILDNGALSGGQHVIPISSTVYFLNVLFFGLHFTPYALMSLLVHAVNTFLVIIFTIFLLQHQSKKKKYIYASLAGIFFLLCPSGMHAITGAAPFYGQNTLSLTFVLLCLITLKKAYLSKQKKFLYFSLGTFLLALLTKETTAFLFIFLPVLVLFEKRVFSFKYLGKLFLIVIIFYFVIRFIIPTIFNHQIPVHITENHDTQTIISHDISIHKDIYKELLFRSIMFPLRTVGAVFIPRPITEAAAVAIAPFIYPSPSGVADSNRTEVRLAFQNGIGIDFLLVIFSICILLLILTMLTAFLKEKKREESAAVLTGIIFILLSALPLVAIVLLFPRWGYDSYFDSRHYYIPTAGAAILFPFILNSLGKFFTKLIRIQITPYIVFILFVWWLITTLKIFSANLTYTVQTTGVPRREIVTQIKQYLPALHKKTIFYIETDGLGAYGPVLPFQTNIAQALSVVYFDRNSLPESFYNSTILNGKSEGYQYQDGRGFGYYVSKKSLAESLLRNEFSVDDIYAFYYSSQDIKITDKTSAVRNEMKKFLQEREEFSDQQIFKLVIANKTLTFKHTKASVLTEEKIPPTETKLLKDISFSGEVNGEIKVMSISPAFDVNEFSDVMIADTDRKKSIQTVVFDKYHTNNAIVISDETEKKYLISFGNVLIIGKISGGDDENIAEFEKILGSINVN